MELTESRATLPDNFLPYISAVACIGEDEYLYVFNVKGECHRLDLTLNVLEHIEKPKGPITTLKTVLVVKSCLSMVVDDSLWVLDQTDLECIWAPAVEGNFPNGHYTVVNDSIYILDLDNTSLKKYAAITSNINEIKDFARNELQALISLVGFGEDSVYFTEVELNENVQSDKQVTLKEYDLNKHKARKAGILKKCPQKHKLD